MGKFFTRCRILMKFDTRVRLKPSNDRGEFELDRASSKNNIAEHETHNGHQASQGEHRLNTRQVMYTTSQASYKPWGVLAKHYTAMDSTR